MKKIFSFILVTVIVITVGLIVYSQLIRKAVKFEEVLPEKPFVFLRLAHLERHLDSLVNSNFYKQISKIDFRSGLKKMGASEKDLILFDKFTQQVSLTAVQEVLKRFFGKEVGLAIYPTSFEEIKDENLGEILSNIFLITRLPMEIQFGQFLSGFARQFQKDLSTQEERYKNYTIYYLRSSDGTINLGYTRIKDLLVFGLGDKAARTCIDTYIKRSKNFAQDSQYEKVSSSFLPESDFQGLFNFDLFLTEMKNQVLKLISRRKDYAEDIQKHFEENLLNMQGFLVMSFSTQFDKITNSKFDIHFDKYRMNPQIRSLYSCSVKDNQTLSLVPKDVLGYQWSNCYDFDYYWEQFIQELKKNAEKEIDPLPPEQVVANMEAALKLSIANDLLPTLGDEIGGYLKDIDTQTVFPVPKLLFFLQVTNKEKAQSIMKNLTALQPLFQPQVEQYRNQPIHYFTNPLFLAILDPGYCVLDHYILIATHRQLIKESLDVSSDPSLSLASAPSFQAMNFGLTDKNNSVFFLQFDQLMIKAKGLVDWSNRWMALQASRSEAFKMGSEKRLTDIKEDIKKEETELENLKSELNAINESLLANPTGGDPTQKVELEMKIREKEQTIESAQGAKAELESMIKNFETQMSTPNSLKVFLEELLKPLADAFANIKLISSKMKMSDEILETFFYIKME